MGVMKQILSEFEEYTPKQVADAITTIPIGESLSYAEFKRRIVEVLNADAG